MITIKCEKAAAHLTSPPELLTAGMCKAVSVKFEYSDDWSGLQKTAVFTNGRKTVDVLPGSWDGERTDIPPEVLAEAGRWVFAGIYGTDDTGVVLPTVWVRLERVKCAADPSGDESAGPELPVWAQILAQIGNLSELDTAAKESLVAAINEIFNTGGGSGNVSSAQISNIVSLSRAEFDELPEKDTRTLYLVEG